MRRFLGALCAAVGLLAPAEAKEVHGKVDAFRTPGVAMAWAVLRGPDEARTIVVVRLRVGAGIEGVTVTGRNLSTKTSKELQRVAFSQGRADVLIPRASFAEYPRTEWKFSGKAKQLPLTVFYVGVPTTAREFAEVSQMDAYLEGRLATP